MQFSRQLIQKSKLLRYPIRYPLYSSMYCFQSYSRIQATSYPFNNNIINNNNFMHNQRLFCAAAADLTDEAILDRIRKVLSTMERAKLDENDPLTAETNVFEKLGLVSIKSVYTPQSLKKDLSLRMNALIEKDLRFKKKVEALAMDLNTNYQD